jgi:hypothetical protein
MTVRSAGTKLSGVQRPVRLDRDLTNRQAMGAHCHLFFAPFFDALRSKCSFTLNFTILLISS